MLKEHWHIYLTHDPESKFSRESTVITYAKNAKKDPSPSNRTDLIVVPSPTSSRYRLLSPSLFLSPFTIFFASSYALRCRRVSPCRKFHPRIAQLIPRSCQPARGTTDLFPPLSLFFLVVGERWRYSLFSL